MRKHTYVGRYRFNRFALTNVQLGFAPGHGWSSVWTNTLLSRQISRMPLENKLLGFLASVTISAFCIPRQNGGEQRSLEAVRALTQYSYPATTARRGLYTKV